MYPFGRIAGNTITITILGGEGYFLIIFVHMKIHIYYVYIVTTINHTVLYTGFTNNLTRRIFEHKKKLSRGFTSKYNVDRLIYFEKFDFVDLAIKREKQIKGYSRIKKDALINSFNPEWKDLYDNGKIQVPVPKSEDSE
jgi:putative endonuclease